MSFASSRTSNLRRVPAEREPTPGFGRTAIVAHVDRWFAASGPESDVRAALVVIDVDIDDALPYDVPGDAITAYAGRDGDPASDGATSVPADGDATEARRRRLGRSVERAVSAQVRPGDAVARIDAGRFAVLRSVLADGGSARTEAAALARGVEDGLVGRPEGHGVRVTAGAATLRSGVVRGGQEALGTVTTAMLEGKLLTDDRVVVVIAAGG